MILGTFLFSSGSRIDLRGLEAQKPHKNAKEFPIFFLKVYFLPLVGGSRGEGLGPPASPSKSATDCCLSFAILIVISLKLYRN